MLRNSLILVTALIATATAQDSDVNSRDLINIFGTPPSTKPSENVREVTVKPTTSPTIAVDKNGESCQCVPYYLCDINNTAVHVTNSSVTGFGILDVRFGDDDDRTCLESVELCCTKPKDPSTGPNVIPTPLASCGQTNPQGVGVTVIGERTTSQFGEYPWVVALLDAKTKEYVGVGALIHPSVVLTVAHKTTDGPLIVRAGEWDTQTVKEALPHQDVVVKEVYRHKDFNPKNAHNDVALLLMERPFQLAQHINPICLPGQDEPFDNSVNCVINGWGKNSFGKKGVYAVFMKKIVQNVVTHAQCNDLLKETRLGKYFKLHDSFVCAGGVAGEDTCEGDGGAPLACPTSDNRYKLAGLVAWSIDCGLENVPTVYASVSRFRQWIDDKMAVWGFGSDSFYNA